MKLPKMNFHNKIFLAYSVIIGLLLISEAIWLLFYIGNTVSKASLKDIQELSLKINQQLDFKVAELNNISTGLLNNDEFKVILKKGANVSQIEYLDLNRRMVNILNTVNTPSSIAKRIVVFRDDNLFYYTGQEAYEDEVFLQKLKNLYWRPLLQDNTGQRLLLTTHIDDWSKKPELCFSLVRNIMNENSRSSGTIEVQQKYSQLEEVCSVDNKVGNVLVVDDKGAVVYPYEAEKDDNIIKLIQYHNKNNTQEEGYFKYQDENSVNQLVAYSKSSYTNWTVFVLKSVDSNIFGVKSTLTIYVAVSFILILGFLLVVIRIMNKYLLKPLRQLTKSINNVSLDNLAVSLEQTDYDGDEIVYLNKAFKNMFFNIEQSISQVIESRTYAAKAQIQALQSQMNPHFIYNTISMIESLSYTSGNKQVAMLCTHFSSMLRYVSDFTKENVLLREEVDHIKNYTTLLKSRYEEYLDINIFADEKCMDIVIPKLIIQPLVENSLEHGLFKVNPPWKVDINIYMEKGALLINITDNGVGINSDKIEELLKLFNECNQKLTKYKDISNTHIGGLALVNIYSRLRFLFEDNFLLTIENVNPRGLKVVIRINNILKEVT